MTESDDEVLGGRVADVFPMVRFVGSDIDDRAWTDAAGATGDGGFERPGLDHGDFFVRVVVFGVGHLAGREGGDVEIDFVVVAIVAPEHVAAFVVRRGIGFHRKLGEVVALGGQRGVGGWGGFGGEGEERGEKEAEVAAGKIWS